MSYRLSFTTGGLYLTESVSMASAYLDDPNWDRAVERATTSSMFPAAKSKSVRRAAREIANRLSTLPQTELEYLVQADRSDQIALLWLAICRTYSLIREFAVEVLAERYASYRREISPSDFIIFVHDKAEADSGLALRSPATLERSRQVLFKMMREAGLVDANGNISRLHLSPYMRSLLDRSPEDKRIFPDGATDRGQGT